MIYKYDIVVFFFKKTDKLSEENSANKLSIEANTRDITANQITTNNLKNIVSTNTESIKNNAEGIGANLNSLKNLQLSPLGKR